MLMLARHRAGKCAPGGEAASGNAARGGRRGGARGEAARGEKRREGDAAGRGPCLLTLGAPLVLDAKAELFFKALTTAPPKGSSNYIAENAPLW